MTTNTHPALTIRYTDAAQVTLNALAPTTTVEDVVTAHLGKPATRMSHADCDHPSTPAMRAKCRRDGNAHTIIQTA